LCFRKMKVKETSKLHLTDVLISRPNCIISDTETKSGNPYDSIFEAAIRAFM
ncbi:MAG: hypothetical protein RL182_609, partial [Actinomycetota bacterium]